MNIAFYSPMKPPDHPVASGDREIARLFIQAIKKAGHNVTVASIVRSWKGKGDETAQSEIKNECKLEIERLSSLYENEAKPDLWFTYHLYHKAPDWIGPAISKALNIPYVVAEASVANKQEGGRWHQGYEQTIFGIRQANAVISLNRQDIPGISKFIAPSTRSVYLPPFLETGAISIENNISGNFKETTSKKIGINPNTCWLVATAMMRDGDKLKSYRVLAKTIRKLKTSGWHLIIIGGGEQEDLVKQLFSDYREKTTFSGVLDKQDILNFFSSSDIFVWPSVNEAFGVALLEAQASGLPVVVGDFGDVSAIVENNKTGFVVADDEMLAEGLADKLDLLIEDNNLRKHFSSSAVSKIHSVHSLESASVKLDKLFKALKIQILAA